MTHDAETQAFLNNQPQFVDVGHSDVAVRSFGRGPDVLFVHGWPLSGATFRGLVPHLSESFTCHVIDLPGAGDTRCRDRDAIELGRHADTVARVADGLGLDRYALLAHDSGGIIARNVAVRHADRVTGLVMGNTEIPGHHPWQLSLYLAAARLPGGPAIFKALLGWRWFRGTNAAFGACFEDMRMLEGPFYDLVVEPLLRDPAVMDDALMLIRTFDPAAMKGLKHTHREMKAPTLLVWGANDPFFPLEKARSMVPQFAAGAELDVVDSGKLFVHEERPAAFAGRALPFLRLCFAAQKRPEMRVA